MIQKYFPNFVGKTQSVMQKDIKSFFHPVNPQMNIPDCEYDRTGLCIAMAKALARNTNHSLYIIPLRIVQPAFPLRSFTGRCATERLCLLF